ncbi:MAG: hypothetical protein QXU32_06110 [Nitrososphaerales archaeon]
MRPIILIPILGVLLITPIQLVLALPDEFSIDGDFGNPTDSAHFNRTLGQTITFLYTGTGTSDVPGTDEFIALRNAHNSWKTMLRHTFTT